MWNPQKVIELQEGYAISKFKGFVSFWNWIANFVFHLKGDGAIVVDDSTKDRPVLKLSGFESASTGSVPVKSGSSLSWEEITGGDVDVVTGISFVIEGGNLKCNLTMSKIKRVTVDSTYTTSVIVSPVSNTNIITEATYNDDGDYALKIKRTSATVLSASSVYSETVFTTTEHS